ncbi:uncharacterized protein stbd1 [Silurus meridionalis]|uniref:Starch-binding domain-containing protein 1 n=1 Tax=Silurus meridionalis TaxID=175797 RepID=A0A8T0AWU7_SILME|nr:uncharacterized protein stbd1 [Silurus meridionalis]KAF7696849.1 hypothetical protein HF521_005267 [Silurus meridionalis]
MSRRGIGAIGVYEAAAAVLAIAIASLSVWGAFLIYRAVKGQRRKRGSEDLTSGTGKEATARGRGGGGEDADDWSKSTGSDDGDSEDWDVDSRKTITLATTTELITTDLLEEITPENVKELTADPCSAVGDTTGSDKDLIKCTIDVRHSINSIHVQPGLFDNKDNINRPSEEEPENGVKENTPDDESEMHLDVDEPSETESAQEILEAKNVPVQKCQSVEDLLDNTLLSQDIVNKPHEEDILVTNSVLHISSDATSSVVKKTSMEDTEVTTKALEKHIPQMNDLDSHCYEDQSDLLCNLASEKIASKIDVKNHQDFNGSHTILNTKVVDTDDILATKQHPSSTFDHILTNPPQNYLGFTVPGLQVDSLVPLKLGEESKDRTEVKPADVSQKKNEISIMEAIMDSNEWLSTGPPDTRDLSLLSQTPSKTFNISSSPVPATTSFRLPAEMISRQAKTDVPVDTSANVTKDEVDLLNKKVGTVLPMPQLVQVNFRVHYITHSTKQILAVTGNQQELGSWESFVPLRSIENGFWSCTISLPLDSQVEWKFILVEEGKIRRWEECENRYFVVSGQEEQIHLHKNWGYA